MAKVLIADDSPSVRKIARSMLESLGYAVLESEDGEQAVQTARSEKPDIILLDAEMPELDGFEAAKQLKSDPQTSSTPIVICTGHDLSEEPEALKECGANSFLVKPYGPQQLADKIKEFIS